MRHSRIHLIVVCLLLFTAGTFTAGIRAYAAEGRSPEKYPLPEMVSGRVELSWHDFKEVLEQLRPPETEAKEEPAPPADWAFNSAVYIAEVTEEGNVRVDATMDLLVLNPNKWVTIPVLHESVAPVSLQLDGEKTSLTRDAGGWFALMLKGPGPHTFETSFYVTPGKTEGKAFFSFPTPRTPLTTMALRIPTPEARVLAPSAASLSATADDKALNVDLAFRSTDSIRVEWFLPATVDQQRQQVKPLIACSAATIAQVAETYIALISTLEFDILRGAVDTFRLALPLEANVFSVDGGEGLVWGREESDGEQVIVVSLNHEVEDAYTIKVEYEVPLARDAESFVIPELEVLDILRSTGTIAVAANANVELSPGAGITNLSRIDTVELPQDLVRLATTPVALGFRYNSPGYALPLEMLVTEPRVACTTTTMVNLSDTHTAVTSRLQFDVLRGAVNTFRVALPLSTNVLSIDGEGIVWSAQEDDARQTIKVSLDREISDSYGFALRYETPVPDDAARIEVPELEVLDMVRSTGYIAVAVSGNIEINTSAETDKIRRIDEFELPATLRGLSTRPILLAFRYNSDGYLLAFDARKLEDVAVQVAVIDRTHVTTLITDQGLSTTLVRYDVRNNERQFLRVTLRDGAEVLGARVAGQPVKPARDGDTKDVLLPLRKSGPDGAAFPVELVYMEHYAEPSGRPLALALESPATDMKANEFYWDVRIPESSQLFNIHTDLEQVKSASDTPRPVTAKTIGVKRETVYQLREGIERFLITDINNPGASATAQSRGYGDSARDPLPKSQYDSAIAAVAGVMPVRVELPEGGKVYSFKRLYVPQGVPMTMTIEMRDKPTRLRAYAIVGGIGLLLGAAVLLSIRFIRRIRGRGSIIVPAMVLLVLVGSAWHAAPYRDQGYGSGCNHHRDAVSNQPIRCAPFDA